MKLKEGLYKLDEKIMSLMKRISNPAIRLSLAIIFIWFGILKPLGLSPAEGLLKVTVKCLPFLSPENWLFFVGWWEVTIGLLFLFKKTTKLAIALLFMQMAGTIIPLILLPEVSFQSGNMLLPTIEGQYIIKNLMIISGALVLGGNMVKTKE